MSVYKMNIEQTIQFIELYRDAECLWKIDLETYIDRDTRNQALEHISDEMNIVGFGIREVTRKIKNVRSAYYQELRKVEESKKPEISAGKIYRPKAKWFPVIDSFLNGYVKINFKKNKTKFNICDLQTQRDNKKQSEEKYSCDQDSPIKENLVNQKGRDKRLKKPPIVHEIISSKKRRIQGRCTSPPFICIEEAIKILDSIQNNSTLEALDYEYWCRYLAKHLFVIGTLRAKFLLLNIKNLIFIEITDHKDQTNETEDNIGELQTENDNLSKQSEEKDSYDQDKPIEENLVNQKVRDISLKISENMLSEKCHIQDRCTSPPYVSIEEAIKRLDPIQNNSPLEDAAYDNWYRDLAEAHKNMSTSKGEPIQRQIKNSILPKTMLRPADKIFTENLLPSFSSTFQTHDMYQNGLGEPTQHSAFNNQPENHFTPAYPIFEEDNNDF